MTERRAYSKHFRGSIISTMAELSVRIAGPGWSVPGLLYVSGYRLGETSLRGESLKAFVRNDLPSHAFRPRPWRTLWFVPISLSIVALSIVLVSVPIPWPAGVLLAIVLGHQYATLFFFGHELMHGSMTQVRALRRLLLYFCYAIFCIPPRFSEQWHLVGHHHGTNVAGNDTDTYGLLHEFSLTRRTKYLFRFTPGSDHWLSAFYMFSFSIQAQVLLWFRVSGSQFREYSRPRAICESTAMWGLWIALATAIGWRSALHVIVVPMLVANFVVLSYGATNHGLRPLTRDRDQFVGSMSVSTLRVLDRLHFHFSHHTEHHMFPSLSSCYAPLVRKSLQTHAGQAYLVPPQWKALALVFMTPRLYLTDDVLVNPYSGRRVPLAAVDWALRAKGPLGLLTIWRMGRHARSVPSIGTDVQR